MAETPPVPRVQQPVFVYREGSDALAKEPPEEQSWITPSWITPSWISPRLLLALIIAVVANLAIIAVIAIGGDPASAATAHAQSQTAPVPVALPAPENLATTLGEGRFVVGTDIAPGTYQTTGPSGYFDCYWERLQDTSGATDSIIANNLGPGPATVTIVQSDAAFQTRWCHTWSKVS